MPATRLDARGGAEAQTVLVGLGDRQAVGRRLLGVHEVDAIQMLAIQIALGAPDAGRFRPIDQEGARLKDDQVVVAWQARKRLVGEARARAHAGVLVADRGSDGLHGHVVAGEALNLGDLRAHARHSSAHSPAVRCGDLVVGTDAALGTRRADALGALAERVDGADVGPPQAVAAACREGKQGAEAQSHDGGNCLTHDNAPHSIWLCMISVPAWDDMVPLQYTGIMRLCQVIHEDKCSVVRCSLF